MSNEVRTIRSDYDFFNEAMNELFPFSGMRRASEQTFMRTDIKETPTDYIMEVEIPGYDKSEIHLDLREGYLSIAVQRTETQKSEDTKYIRRERSIACSRSYYIGNVDKEDIRARYENGILTLTIPKDLPKTRQATTIAIE